MQLSTHVTFKETDQTETVFSIGLYPDLTGAIEGDLRASKITVLAGGTVKGGLMADEVHRFGRT